MYPLTKMFLVSSRVPNFKKGKYVFSTINFFFRDCHVVNKYWNFTLSGYGRVTGETHMMNEIYKGGPISCAIANTIELEKYSGGIFVDETGTKDLNHVISIIGWGEEDGIPYWYVRNSWGT